MKNRVFLLPMLLTAFLFSLATTMTFSMERPRVKLSARVTSSVEDLRNIANQYKNKRAKAINVIDTFYKIDNRNQAEAELNRLGLSLDQLSKEARRDYLGVDEPTPTTRRPAPKPKPVPKVVPTPPTTKPTAPKPGPKVTPTPQPKRPDVKPTTAPERKVPTLRPLPAPDVSPQPQESPRTPAPNVIILPGPETPAPTAPSLTPSEPVKESPPTTAPEVIILPCPETPAPTAPSLTRQPEEPVVVPEVPEESPRAKESQISIIFDASRDLAPVKLQRGNDPELVINKDKPEVINLIQNLEPGVISRLAEELDQQLSNDELRVKAIKQFAYIINILTKFGTQRNIVADKLAQIINPVLEKYQGRHADTFKITINRAVGKPLIEEKIAPKTEEPITEEAIGAQPREISVEEKPVSGGDTQISLNMDGKGFDITGAAFQTAVADWDVETIVRAANKLNNIANTDKDRLRILKEFVESLEGKILNRKAITNIQLLTAPLINNYINKPDLEFSTVRKQLEDL